ncbi:glycosyltransferase family 39 protein [Galbitalea sp. SE-J8]|uniref:ArnT family glycosyltransferase n=1 Tax=Galbitalea sp. SE-J8 TaxID=3054952 RepID=UPI00259C9240|nr:glycosyltransferase family 39 protein [Galbitalea sp. SE-J8]MDM4762744.1 glycosyltransferase family 39 protein [Galbitalea sp. SE-J8]
MERPALARLPVATACAALAIVLAATSWAYGYHRDELYFRMLPLAWSYVDQPPLVPALVHLTRLLGDEVWILRVPAVLLAVGSVPIVALIARETGGGRGAQALAAWGYAFGAFTLTGGHTLLTASVDLVVWPAIVLCALRALGRDPRWWLAVGLIAGASTWNKLLVAMLLVALAIGLATCGPWRAFRTPWLYAGVALLAVLAAPQLVYQAQHGWPQLAVGAGLAASNAADVRVTMWPFLLILIGPTLVPVWVAGLVRAARDPRLRFIAVAFAVVLIEVCAAGSQFYYDYGIVVAVFAIGCAPAARWAASRARRGWLRAAVVANILVTPFLTLPLLPASVSPAPLINQAIADQVGWPHLAAQVAGVVPAGTPVVAANYGEAGALDRFEPGLEVYSAHNALYDLGRPADRTDRVVTVGLRDPGRWFASCSMLARLDNGLGVDNEEQGAPVQLCSAPTLPWSALWPRLRHLD